MKISLLLVGVFVIAFLLLSIAMHEAGLKQGYDNGWKAGQRCGFQRGSAVWAGIQAKAGSGSVKDVPWDEFDIQQKMFLCAYGSAGNKMSERDLSEIIGMYGPENGKVSWETIASELGEEAVKL